MQVKYELTGNPREPVSGKLTNFLAYTFKNDKIIVNYQGKEETFDFSSVSITDGFIGIECEELDINPFMIERNGQYGVLVENSEIKAKLIYLTPLDEFKELENTETSWEVV